MDKESIDNNFYKAAVISVLAFGYSVLGKKVLKVAPPSIQKFDLEDTGKRVVIVARSEYIITQKILPKHINILKNSEHSNVDWGSIGKCLGFHWKFLLAFETIQGWY